MKKILIASDIHGSADCLDALLNAFAKEGAERLVLLGDLLYHGPRNDLPVGYDPKRCISLLSEVKDKILAVRGNCDTEVDQMVLPFPILADYAILLHPKRTLYLTHGHTFGEATPPPLAEGDLLLCGHTHVPKVAVHDRFTYLNPGSVSIPKEGSKNSYLLLLDDTFYFKTLQGEVYNTFSIS